MAKSSLAAAFLNFVLWGSGYLYRDERKGFGIMWLVAYIFAHLPIYYLGVKFYYTQPPGILMLLAHLTISVLLGYDVYKT